jgi:hypothetical protein
MPVGEVPPFADLNAKVKPIYVEEMSVIVGLRAEVEL